MKRGEGPRSNTPRNEGGVSFAQVRLGDWEPVLLDDMTQPPWHMLAWCSILIPGVCLLFTFISAMQMNELTAGNFFISTTIDLSGPPEEFWVGLPHRVGGFGMLITAWFFSVFGVVLYIVRGSHIKTTQEEMTSPSHKRRLPELQFKFKEGETFDSLQRRCRRINFACFVLSLASATGMAGVALFNASFQMLIHLTWAGIAFGCGLVWMALQVYLDNTLRGTEIKSRPEERQRVGFLISGLCGLVIMVIFILAACPGPVCFHPLSRPIEKFIPQPAGLASAGEILIAASFIGQFFTWRRTLSTFRPTLFLPPPAPFPPPSIRPSRAPSRCASPASSPGVQPPPWMMQGGMYHMHRMRSNMHTANETPWSGAATSGYGGVDNMFALDGAIRSRLRSGANLAPRAAYGGETPPLVASAPGPLPPWAKSPSSLYPPNKQQKGWGQQCSGGSSRTPPLPPALTASSSHSRRSARQSGTAAAIDAIDMIDAGDGIPVPVVGSVTTPGVGDDGHSPVCVGNATFPVGCSAPHVPEDREERRGSPDGFVPDTTDIPTGDRGAAFRVLTGPGGSSGSPSPVDGGSADIIPVCSPPQADVDIDAFGGDGMAPA